MNFSFCHAYSCWSYNEDMFRVVSIAMLLAANDEVNGVLIRYDRFVKNGATAVEGVGVAPTETTPPTQQAEPAIGQEVSGEKRHSPVNILLWCVHVGGCVCKDADVCAFA